jgi:hypothetical protein
VAASIERRLADLESRAGLYREPPEPETVHEWVRRRERERRWARPEAVWRVRGTAVHYAKTVYPELDADALLDKILERPSPGLTRGIAERELFLLIYRGDERVAHLAGQVPEEWADAFRAGDELLQRILDTPDEVLAAAFVRLRGAAETGDDARERDEAAALGFDNHLCLKALGPDADLLDEEQISWRLAETISEFTDGRRGFAVSTLMVRLEKGATDG